MREPHTHAFAQRNAQHVQRILGLLGQNRTLDGAVRVLIAIGAWKPHVLVKVGCLDRDGFSNEVETLAKEYMTNPPADLDEKSRVDLTHLKTVTIDDISTTEIDDGLSVERLDGGKHRIWIHIADPTRWMSREDVIFKEAQRRATSVYIPTGVIPMMPYDIATQTFSLVKDKVTCAFSLGVRLDMETGAIDDYLVTPTKIRVDERLTYVKTDELLAAGCESEEPELSYLAAAAKARWAYRKANGAHTFASFSPKIRATIFDDREEDEEGADVLIERNDAQQQTAEYKHSGQSIVSEMMILAGEVGALWGKDNGVALPYRVHYMAQSEEPLQLSSLSRAVISTKPTPHAGLGLPGYTQMSSPIRRFNDIVVHLQMKNVLRGEGPLFGPDEMKEMAEAAYFVEREIKEIQMSCEQYWIAEYFKRHPGDKLWDATFLSWRVADQGLGYVQIDELGLRVNLEINTPISPGEKLLMKAVEICPRLDGQSVMLFEQIVQ